MSKLWRFWSSCFNIDLQTLIQTGLILKEETVLVKIPAGVEDGMQLKVSGKGNDSAGNGIAGDLIVLISEKEHDTFKKRRQ